MHLKPLVSSFYLDSLNLPVIMSAPYRFADSFCSSCFSILNECDSNSPLSTVNAECCRRVNFISDLIVDDKFIPSVRKFACEGRGKRK